MAKDGYAVEFGQYEGRPTIALLGPDGRKVLSFGVRKARAVVACFAEVESFVHDVDERDAKARLESKAH